MRLTGSNSSASPKLSSTGTYKFKIAANGIVTKKSTYGNITSGLNTESMTELFNDYMDDESYHIDMDGDSVSFLGNTYSQLYVSGNGGFSFGSENDLRNGGDNDPVTDNGDPCIYMVNNDASLEQVWATSLGGGTIFAYKIMGNTNYDNSGVNYEYDIYFYSNGTVDVFVVQEPTDWDDYNDGLGNVQWGVTNGTNWVDGYTNHFSSFGAGVSGLRITGNGIRFTGTPIPAGLFVPTVAPQALFVGEADFEMGAWSSGDPTQVPDISGYNHGMSLNNNNAGNANWYNFYNNSAQANDTNWPVLDVRLTIMGWFAFSDFNKTDISLVSRTNGNDGWALRVDTNGTQINLVKYNVMIQRITLGAPLTTNQWHYISVSQNGSSVIFNVDGQLYTTSGAAVPFSDDGGAPVRLQYDPHNGGNQNTQMWMRDVKILPFEYDAAWLYSYYNSLKTGYGY